MLIKINNKPIAIEEETEKPLSIPYLIISSIGYIACLWLLDYTCFLFISKHIFPFVGFITKILSWIGVL